MSLAKGQLTGPPPVYVLTLQDIGQRPGANLPDGVSAACRLRRALRAISSRFEVRSTIGPDGKKIALKADEADADEIRWATARAKAKQAGK